MKLSLLLSLASAFLSVTAAAAVPEGSFRGSSVFLRGADVMALIMRQDANDPRKGYAVLSEYTRVPYIGIVGPERLEITRWVPRMYIYRVEETGADKYSLTPLRVSGAGLDADTGYSHPSELTWVHGGSDARGAVLTRYEKNSLTAAETIDFDGRVSSTWQPYVAGRFFGSHDATGGDYFRKDHNTVLREDHVGEFHHDGIDGNFRLSETVPGIWLLTPEGQAKGAEKMVTKIGVFIDIVNWKPFFTTNELLLINPDDAKDVGFYYQRH